MGFGFSGLLSELLLDAVLTIANGMLSEVGSPILCIIVSSSLIIVPQGIENLANYVQQEHKTSRHLYSVKMMFDCSDSPTLWPRLQQGLSNCRASDDKMKQSEDEKVSDHALCWKVSAMLSLRTPSL